MTTPVLSRYLAVVACACACHGSGAPHAVWLDARSAPAIEGLDVGKERPFRLADERGKVVLLAFGYTSCVELCPDTFAKAKDVLHGAAETSSRIEFVYVTVDPERDTPTTFRTFMDAVDPRFDGIYVPPDRLGALLAAYGVTVRKRLPTPSAYAHRDTEPTKFYSMDHTADFWLVDPAGQLRVRYDHDVSAGTVVHDAKQLLAEAS